MSVLVKRLARLRQVLSPEERARLVLQALNRGEEPDPELKNIGDVGQRRAFNGYMALIAAANLELDAVCHSLLFQAQRLEADQNLQLMESAGRLAAEQLGE